MLAETPLIVALLLGCAPSPVFACCDAVGGLEAYPAPDPSLRVTSEARDVVHQAISEGVIPYDVNVDVVARSAAQHAMSRPFWRHLSEVSADYLQVAAIAESMGRPKMEAAEPLLLTGYRRDTSRDCRSGVWHLQVADPRFQVGPCHLTTMPEGLWQRDREPLSLTIDSQGRCAVEGCSPDERQDLEVSTRVVFSDPAEGWPYDRSVAAGVHLVAVCGLPGERPAHCVRVRTGLQAGPQEPY